MFRANFFINFFKSKKINSYEILKYDIKEDYSLQDQINIQIMDVNEKISLNSKALAEAQLVKLRSTFSISDNLIEKIGKNVYKNKLEESIQWHQKTIKDLYLKRRELVINLEKIKGIFWLNQIKRFLRIILLVCFIIFSLIIFLSSFMLVIYAMPFIILIFIVYLIFSKKY
tara:strand:- start:24 stop:536 length:513 start_codon:yes stop_codon:yes gene_type:complete